MRMTRGVVSACLTLLTVGAPAVAQDLSEVCPDAEDGTGALQGLLSDANAQMGLPGATVVARWTIDGAPGRAEGQTSIDGSFTLCSLPLETELAVLGMVGSVSGVPLAVMLTDHITRREVQLSLTGTSAAGASGEQMLACFGAPDSALRNQVAEFVRCDIRWRGLKSCPRENLGRVSTMARAFRAADMPGWLEELIEKARELGANALVDYERAEGAGAQLRSAQAVLIKVDPASC